MKLRGPIPSTEHLLDMDKYEVMKDILPKAEPGSIIFEQSRLVIDVKSSIDLESSIKLLAETIGKQTNSNISLSNKIFWLNIILTLLTLVGVVFAGLELFK